MNHSRRNQLINYKMDSTNCLNNFILLEGNGQIQNKGLIWNTF